MDPVGLLRSWEQNPDRDGELVHVHEQPARQARFGQVDLDPLLAARLTERGIDLLYRHQARAIAAVRSGTNVVLAAGTAAGKSLCFQVPILEAILKDPKTTSLLIYPTKALAQDQAASLRRFNLPGAHPAIYDGDTELGERSGLRKRANLVLTNPDMLHVGILPFHDRWADFLHRLAFIVVDEVHSLRGIFGTHVAMILRRLRRLAAHYGSSPQFILSSATIGNAGDLARRLTGADVEVIDGDDSPSGRRVFALWNPPLIDADLGRRRSPLGESAEIFGDLVSEGYRTIAF
ncbi:MAG: DEAD/DEAH box helicase, partial [Acidimicrobiia bacterium]